MLDVSQANPALLEAPELAFFKDYVKSVAGTLQDKTTKVNKHILIVSDSFHRACKEIQQNQCLFCKSPQIIIQQIHTHTHGCFQAPEPSAKAAAVDDLDGDSDDDMPELEELGKDKKPEPQVEEEESEEEEPEEPEEELPVDPDVISEANGDVSPTPVRTYMVVHVLLYAHAQSTEEQVSACQNAKKNKNMFTGKASLHAYSSSVKSISIRHFAGHGRYLKGDR